jgi:hypothetical protein
MDVLAPGFASQTQRFERLSGLLTDYPKGRVLKLTPAPPK